MAFSYNDIKSALDQAKAATGGKFVAFDAAYYVQHYSIVKDPVSGAILDNSLASFTGDPLKHYVETGAAKGYAPNAWFDATFYRAQYADVRNGYTNADLIAHYALFGAYEGRAPSAKLAAFDGARYLRDNPEVATYVDANLSQFGGSANNGAIAHFVLFGANEGRHGYTTAGVDTGFTFVPATAEIAPHTTGNVTELALNTNGGQTALIGNNAVADGDAATTGADTLRLTGDAAVRIDMTNPANQLRGIDLNGNGTIEANGIENNVSGVNKVTVKNFEIVDAYARNPLNEGDRAHNFTGSLNYDGTGFDGDGVSTDGNIVLGGLGADNIKGGIGNDFLAGGGVAGGHGTDTLSGGRNADFFFAELSELDNTDGNSTMFDGGTTSDDSAAGAKQTAQDNDWLLIEASDDDEPVQITLRNENTDSADVTTGSIVTRAGQHVATLKDIENVNASGNLYGFLNGVDVEMGGRRLDNRDVAGAENYGLGSSAQLNIDGSSAANTIIGGYDNDNIAGNAGDDLLFGGDLRYIKTNNNNPNLTGITNDGVDNLSGGAGNDSLVVELDRGTVDGGAGHDTLYLTDYSIGRPAATEQLSNDTTLADGRVRLDLGYANYDGYRGYNDDLTAGNGQSMRLPGRHNTADQTNYKVADTATTTAATIITNNESVVATGLGAIDYKAAGSNNPDLNFANQQNYNGINANLDLRGTDSDSAVQGESSLTTGVSTQVVTSSILNIGSVNNILYANTGNDVVEGRTGNDLLSGGNGVDDFVFGTANGGSTIGDGVDVIWRQKDANSDGLWDAGTKSGGWTDETRYTGDFGQNVTQHGSSSYKITFKDESGKVADGQELSAYVSKFNSVSFKLDGAVISASLATPEAPTYAGVDAAIENALTVKFGADAATRFSVTNDKATNSITIVDKGASPEVGGGVFSAASAQYDAAIVSGDKVNTTLAQVYSPPGSNTDQDRLIFKAYEDRADNEGVDDDSVLGSSISLGTDAYAQDRVVSIDANGTRIAESQAYNIGLKNLTTEDEITVSVNGVTYTLTVGRDLDGNLITGEDFTTAQETIQTNFGARLAAFINSFMDDDTAAGKIHAAYTDAPDAANHVGQGVLTLTQSAYHGEETVFVKAPSVSIKNASGGEPATYSIENTSNHEVLLYQYDGSNNNLNASNVLFVGEEFERNGSTAANSRSILATAKDAGGALNGSEAIVIDGMANTLQANLANGSQAAIFDNQTTRLSDFSVHGDDLLIGGKGVDTINAGTGDDRVIGSIGSSSAPTLGGTDGERIDGGKNYYKVQVLGEEQARVYVLNKYEAANLTITGKTISSIAVLDQDQDGTSLVSGLFDDTLLFQQADFTAGKTQFTITLDDFAVESNVVKLKNDGAGLVGVDVDGNGIIDNYTRFTNFENIRTVSGVGKAVAGDGQGNDTLNISALSTATGGVSYDLTGDATAGQVKYSVDAHTDLTRPAAADFESQVIRVDGVENVIAGTGDDLLLIDETEAAKNNSFDGSTGDDRIEYQNDYGLGAGEPVAEPTITIKVNTASNTDQVVSTAGRVGTTVATDTLTDIEFITLAGHTAEGSRENDVLDVTAMKSGAVVSYVDGTVKDLAGNTQVTIEGIADLENVWADGNDTVIVADADVMKTNAREDVANATASADLTFATFIDFDTVVGSGTTPNARVSYANQTPAQIENAVNNGEFKFDLSKTGTGADLDTVDYSNAQDNIAVVVDLNATNPQQYVLVDSDGAVFFDGAGDLTESGDRVDVLTSVERIVAAQGQSVLDLSASNKDLEIKFKAPDVANRVATLDRDVSFIQITEQSSTATVTSLSRDFVEYRDAGTSATVTQAKATWNRIEGSDKAERIIESSIHSFDSDALNLRGGNNEVKYNELTKSISLTLGVSDFDATATAFTTGVITGTVTFQDGTGAGVEGPALIGGGTHTITSYTANNGVAAGSLAITASVDAEDALKFSAGQADKLFLVSEVGTTDNQITVKLGSGAAQNSIVLKGFELLVDSDANDTYDFGNLSNAAAGLNFTDNAANDHDTIKVGDDAIGFNAGLATNLSLVQLNAASTLAPAGFEFDVLDITKVTNAALTTVTGIAAGEGTDEVVLGALPAALANVNDFEAVVGTQAFVTQVGTSFTLDTTANQLVAGAKTLQFNQDMNVLSFGGTALEGTLGDSTALNATTGVTVTTVGNDDVTLVGGNGNDSLTGSGGDDYLRGGQGNDTLDGARQAATGEVATITLGGGAAVLSGVETLTLTGNAATLVISGSGGAGEIVTASATADADQIGALLMAQTNAFLETELGYAAGSIASKSYDAASNVFSINFTVAAGNVANLAAAVSAGTMTAVAGNTAPAAAVESSDTYVFEKTAALNGVDTINNFNAANLATDDLLDFTAFLGAAANTGAVVTATNGTTGILDLSGATDVGVLFNKAGLVVADIVATLGAATAGQIVVENNSKAVVLVTADTDGVADAVSTEAYKVYFVEDTDATAATSFAVTLVGTVNGAAELSANNFLAGTDAFA